MLDCKLGCLLCTTNACHLGYCHCYWENNGLVYINGDFKKNGADVVAHTLNANRIGNRGRQISEFKVSPVYIVSCWPVAIYPNPCLSWAGL